MTEESKNLEPQKAKAETKEKTTEKGVENKAAKTGEKSAKAEKTTGKEEKTTKATKTKSKAKRRNVPEGAAYIQASYNNTIISLTEPNGNVIVWSSAGASGFKGARKATPYAAQVAAENAAEKAKVFGLERVHVYVKGVGTGREQAIRGLVTAGLNLLTINDLTPMPHNGCRKRKARRV